MNNDLNTVRAPSIKYDFHGLKTSVILHRGLDTC
jgi:hypothetical protein